MQTQSPHEVEFTPRLRFFDALTIVVGSMIGSGIFIVSANIAHDVGSPAMLLAVWAVTGVMTITAALSYGELGAMMPKAGGQYVFLRESFGHGAGFLYGWTLFLVIQTGTIAAVAVAFAKFIHLFIPAIALDPWIYPLRGLGVGDFAVSSGQLVAIALIFFLSGVNMFGIRTGSTIQNIFTVAKVLGLLLLIAIAFFSGKGSWENFSRTTPAADNSWLAVLMIFGGAMVGSLFSSDAWNNITFAGSEVLRPKRNLPLALAIGTILVTGIYVLTNVAYLYVLPIGSIANVAELARSAQTTTIGGEIIRLVAGETWAKLFAAAVLISVFGCLNGLILSGARVYYAMAKDGLFFSGLGDLHPRYVTPVRSLLFQALWAGLLTLSGTYSQLLDYVVFAVLIFYILTVLGIFVLRKKQPDRERPYKAFGYPILPALYILLAASVCIDLLFVKPDYTWPGLIVVAVGVPVYFAWNARRKRAGAAGA